MKRLIAVGDIHGQRAKLEELLGKVQPSEVDQLIFLGDYIDRGPDSRGVIELLIGLRESLPLTIFLKGNHEQMLLNALLETKFVSEAARPDISSVFLNHSPFSDIQLFLLNGGLATLQSYAIEQVDDLPPSHLAFIRQTRLYFRKDGFLFVHAGARNDLPLEQQDEQILLWERGLAPGDSAIHVVGHTPTANGLPVFEPGRYSLDTGAGHGRPLTACEVRTKEYWQA